MKAIDLAPGPELDKLFFERVEGLTVRQITDSMPEWVQGRDWALPGDYVIDVPDGLPYPCPNVSEENNEALAALERFAEKKKIGWTISRAPYRGERYYYATLFGDGMPMESQQAATLAHAVVLAILAAAEVPNG